MMEHTYPTEDEARTARRALIDQGAQVSLLAFDPARDRYVFDAATCPNGHAQTVAAYCVADDDGTCIPFESVALSPAVVARILAGGAR